MNGHKASYARAPSARVFKMFTFLQSLPSQCRPREAAALEMSIISCNMNELETKARYNCFPGRQDVQLPGHELGVWDSWSSPPHFTTDL